MINHIAAKTSPLMAQTWKGRVLPVNLHIVNSANENMTPAKRHRNMRFCIVKGLF